MANITFSIDPDGTGDYLSQNTFEAAEQTDLVTATNNYIVECTSSAGSADVDIVEYTGWTTNSTYYISIQAKDGDQALKTGWDDTRYRLSVNSGSTALTITTDYTRVIGLQIENINRRVMSIGSTECIVDSCVARSNSGYASGYGIGVLGVGTTNHVYNCIVYGYGTLLIDTGYLADNGHLDLYNSIAYGCVDDGVFIANDATATIKNCAITECADDFAISGTSTIDYNASDDGDGTNAVIPTNWALEFADAANFDFTLLTGGDLEGAGVGPSVDSLVPVLDIDGTSRSGATCDIGADEYFVIVVTGGNPWYYYAQQ